MSDQAHRPRRPLRPRTARLRARRRALGLTSSRETFELRLHEARACCPSEEVGLFGPQSMTWAVNREAVILLGGGAAALLQAAHPFVAHAVVEHSAALSDARGRLRRTLDAVYLIVFGEWRSARGVARRIRAIHDRIRGILAEDVGCFRAGDPYDANAVDAQRWVAATLLYTSVQLFERTVRPLSAAEKDRLTREHARFCLVFGIPAAQCEQRWDDFLSYWHRMLGSDQLAVGTHARIVCEGILRAPDALRWPAYRWLQAFTASLLPPHLARAFGLPSGPLDRAVAAASLRLLRLTRWMPPRLRFVPGYLDAQRRLAGRRGLDARTEALWDALYATLLPARR